MEQVEARLLKLWLAWHVTDKTLRFGQYAINALNLGVPAPEIFYEADPHLARDKLRAWLSSPDDPTAATAAPRSPSSRRG